MKDNFFDNLEDYKSNKKIKCVNCGREVKDLEKGCSYCNNSKEYNTENYNVRLENIMKEKNTISSILKVIAWIIIVLGFILGFILGQNEYDEIEFSSLMTIWLTYGGVSLGIFALAEIIQILHDIRFKVWKGKK
ncbi:MAG: hypothetical protein ACI310_06820 [Bacilli bacterium]